MNNIHVYFVGTTTHVPSWFFRFLLCLFFVVFSLLLFFVILTLIT